MINTVLGPSGCLRISPVPHPGKDGGGPGAMGTAISFTTRVARGRSTGRSIVTRVTSVATGVSTLGTSLGTGGTRLGFVSGRVTGVRTGGVGTRAGTTRSTGGTRTRSMLGGLLTDNVDTSRVLTGLGWSRGFEHEG